MLPYCSSLARVHQELSRKPPTPSTRSKTTLNYGNLDTIYLREMSLYFLKFAIDQITSAAPAQKDAGGTVEE